MISPDLADEFDSYPLDHFWTTSMRFVAETLSILMLRDPAALVYARMAPFAANLPHTPTMIWEVGHHSLGRLATVLGRYDDAEAHFHAAADTHQRIRAPYLLASTRLTWAEMLARRARDGDRAWARDLARQAATIATESGYAGVQHWAQTLLDQLS